MSKRIVIGSRGSDLALWQANYVMDLLDGIGIKAEIKVIKTKGDKVQDIGFDKMEGKGFFTKEIEAALLDGSIDLAVHSHKDLETTQPQGLCIAAVPEREDAAELLLARRSAVDHKQLFSSKEGAVVGTSSARRKNQLALFRPDVQIKDLRGNVPTRINKLRDEQYDAILLAKAGVSRLGLDLSDLHVEELDPRHFIPAPAQGALAIQVRESDARSRTALEQLNSIDRDIVQLERSILRHFQGGCQVPLGVHAHRHGTGIDLWVSAAREWQKTPKRICLNGAIDGLAQRALALLTKEEHLKVFISRDLEEGSIFKQLLERNGHEVEGVSLIETEAIPFTELPEHDRVFFSSKNGVEHFFTQYNGERITHADAVGPGTAKALAERGITVGFIGDGADTTAIGMSYAKVVDGAKVLFVAAEQGSRKVRSGLPEEQIAELHVYRTVQRSGLTLTDADILVFTSSSNALAYLKNGISADQRVVAIGTTTKETLEENGIAATLPWASTELALADAVLSLPNGNDQ